MTRPYSGIGQPSLRTQAIRMKREGFVTDDIASSLGVSKEQVTEWLWGKPRKPLNRSKSTKPDICPVCEGSREKPKGAPVTIGPESTSPIEIQPCTDPFHSAKPKPRRSTLKQGKGFAASKAQREKVKERGSIISGQEPCDPCHLWPRGRGGCDDPLCVIPLTRQEHRAFDEGKLDILPALHDHGCVAELQHALGHAGGNLIGLLQRVTGEHYTPAPDIPEEFFTEEPEPVAGGEEIPF